MDKRYFLGVDLGTSSIKIVLIDEDKEVLAQHTENYTISSPDFGWREIDPAVWFNCMAKGMDDLFTRYDPRKVEAIGITGQMHTIVMLDEAGNSIRPALMWDDIRARDLIPELREKFAGRPDCAYMEKNISTGSPAANLYWLRRFEYHNFIRVRKFLIAPDYLVYRLTGTYGADYSEASTSCLYDIQERQWSPFMRDLLELDETVYPEVRGSAIIAGPVTTGIAQRFSMRNDVKVLTGMGDNPATALLTGCLGQGYPVISLGTSGVVMKETTKLVNDAKGKTILFSLDDHYFSYLVQGALQSNGGSFKWWIHSIMGIDDFSAIDSLLQNYPMRKSDLLFFPHLLGEKTLFSDPDIRGAFIGLSTLTTREDMMYAVIEGLCYGYRELMESMRIDLHQCAGLRIVGGGAQNKVQAQILANVLNVVVEQMDGIVSPAFGIALLAAHTCGFIPSFDQIVHDTIKVKEIIGPQAEMTGICQKKYTHYKKIYPALKTIYG
jgi:xylulokinase